MRKKTNMNNNILKKSQIIQRLKSANAPIRGYMTYSDLFELIEKNNNNLSYSHDTRVLPLLVGKLIKERITWVLQCQQKNYPPIQIKSEKYSVGTLPLGPDSDTHRLNDSKKHYFLHVHCGPRTFFYEYTDQQLARYVFAHIQELYGKNCR